MEELYQAALAYFNNWPVHIQQLALDFFHVMDRNGDDKVSLAEFVTFLQQHGYGSFDPNFFHHLDRNGDGSLDFSEVLTFLYIIKTRNLCCKACRGWLIGLYFTCVVCFDGATDSYDLCSGCYSRGSFRHSHNCFLDNHILLRAKRRQATGLPNLYLVSDIIFICTSIFCIFENKM